MNENPSLRGREMWLVQTVVDVPMKVSPFERAWQTVPTPWETRDEAEAAAYENLRGMTTRVISAAELFGEPTPVVYEALTELARALSLAQCVLRKLVGAYASKGIDDFGDLLRAAAEGREYLDGE